MTTKITLDDLHPILEEHEGNDLFRRIWEGIDNGDRLLSALGRYVHFNATFGGSVANLAGEIAVRQNLFRDSAEPISILADRSIEVASDIIAAAIDEFDDRGTAFRDTHRSLAQATLKGAGSFFQKDNETLNSLFQPDAPTLDAVGKVHQGYGVNRQLDEIDLFRALGFHAGSEILADEEFRILDESLRTRFPELVEMLQVTKVPLNGEEHLAYYWIHIHTSVEADHFAFAVQGVNRALEFYAGETSSEQAKGWVIEGFKQFADMQTVFMRSLSVTDPIANIGQESERSIHAN